MTIQLRKDTKMLNKNKQIKELNLEEAVPHHTS